MDRKMYETKVADDYEELSSYCADILVDTVKKKSCAAIVIATGHSPLLAYRMFVKRIREEEIDVSRIIFIKLDEWLGLLPECEATCEYFIRRELLEPLDIAEECYIGFNGNALDWNEECNRIQKRLEEIRDIDLVILGIGKNGHLGLNEPEDFLVMGPHITLLDKKTQLHTMLEGAKEKVSKGVTLGIGNLLASQKAVLLVTGSEKEEAVSRFLGEHITSKVPVSFLKLHRNMVCIIERKFLGVSS